MQEIVSYFSTLEMVYINGAKMSDFTAGAEGVIWTEANCHGMTNDG